MTVAEIPGGTLSYEILRPAVAEPGPPLVLLLPQSTGPLGLQPLIDALARRHTVITYDQRGTGGSSPAPGSGSMATQADDVIALLDVLEIGQASLLCHSTGCGIGISVAVKYQKRVSALALVAPWTYGDPHLTSMQNLRVAAARALDPKQYARFNAALLFPPEFRRAHQAGFERIATAALATPQDADEIARRLAAILAFDARPLLPAIKAKTIVITAKDDQLMPTWLAVEASQSVARAELIELDGGGHMLLETRAAGIDEIMTRFLL